MQPFTLYYAAKDFIRKLLVVDPKKRLTATEALNHAWMTLQQIPTIDAKQLAAKQQAELAEKEPAMLGAPGPAPPREHVDLLPRVKVNMRKWRAAVDALQTLQFSKSLTKLADAGIYMPENIDDCEQVLAPA